jgi:hypothetical protein
VECIRQFDLPTVCLWRNLGDIVISLAEHVGNELHEMPVCFIPDRRAFCVLKRDEQHAFMIANALPWYLGFRQGWSSYLRFTESRYYRYEDMCENPVNCFSDLIARVDPMTEIDLPRLRRAMIVSKGQQTRKNIGVVGRSIEDLSSANKNAVESAILNLAGAERELLIEELPWRAR